VTTRALEVELFRLLNRVLEPPIRAGLGSPILTPGGFVVLETRGRKTGRLVRTPLAATRFGDHVLVATFRGGRSHWVRNLAARPETRVWLGGRSRAIRGYLIDGAGGRAPRELPAPLRLALGLLRPLTHAGWVFAVLAPRGERRARAGARRSR
jgi:deazaflavin-dependent oxidoreductase (nitroreductase family)